MKEKNFISAVVYIHNDSNNIVSFIKKLSSILDSNFLNYEILFVNDGSTDDTVEKIKEIAKDLKKASITVINMSFFQGKEISMNAGVDLAIGDYVYQFDTVTIDYDIDIIMDIYKKSLEGYDIVNAIPNKKRKFTSKLFYSIFNKNSNFAYKLDTETFQIMSRRAINRIYAINKSVPYRKAIQANSGLKIGSIKYDVKNDSKDKIDSKEKRERSKNAINSLILFTDISYKITLTFSVIMLAFIVFVTIYTVVVFFTENPVEGWTPTMLFLASGFFGIFLILTIIIKYLSIILNLIFKKTNFLIESIDKIK